MHDVKRDMVVSRIALPWTGWSERNKDMKQCKSVQERNNVDRNRNLLLLPSNGPIPGRSYFPISGHHCSTGGCAGKIVSYRMKYVLYNADRGYLRGCVEGGFFSISHVPGLDPKWLTHLLRDCSWLATLPLYQEKSKTARLTRPYSGHAKHASMD